MTTLGGQSGMVSWFTGRAAALRLELFRTPDGILWAWWGDPWPAGGPPEPGVVTGGVLTGGGGAPDPGGGGTGLPAAFAAVEALQAAGHVPARPVGVAGFPPSFHGPGAVQHPLDHETIARTGVFVELQREPGRRLAAAGPALGIATGIWPHGVWHFRFDGVAAPASTPLADRQDPALEAARTVLAARELAIGHQALVTVIRLSTAHSAAGHAAADGHDGCTTGGVAARVDAWLDARAPSEADLLGLVEDLVRDAAATGIRVAEEHWSPPVVLDPDLRDRVARIVDASLERLCPGAAPVPLLSSGEDQLAGLLTRAGVPAALILARNDDHPGTAAPPVPDVEPARAGHAAGVAALTSVLHDLSS